MASDLWNAVDQYIADQLIGPDAVLAGTLAQSAAAGLPPISVSPPQGKLLNLYARMLGARQILELGTLGGYSAIWLARALPADGLLVTVECDPRHADVARKNFVSAGVHEKVDLRLGRAIDVLAELRGAGAGPFDLVFIDADKPSAPDYFSESLSLTRPGGVIIVDNVVRDGKVIEAESADGSVRGIRRLNEMVAVEPRVTATAVQTVGSKGYDGFLLAFVRS